MTERLGGRGLFGVEMFVVGDDVIFSEVIADHGASHGAITDHGASHGAITDHGASDRVAQATAESRERESGQTKGAWGWGGGARFRRSLITTRVTDHGARH